MAEADPQVIDKPSVAKTNIGQKFVAEMDKLKGKTIDAPLSATVTEKAPEKPAGKPASALDAALGEVKPEKKPDEGEWEKEEVVKEFDPQKANWAKARETMGRQSLTVKQLNTEVERLKKESAKGDPKATEELAVARQELGALKDTLAQREKDIKSINAEYSDEYRSLLKAKDNIVQKAVSRVKAYGGDGEALMEALQLPEGRVKSSQIKEIISALEPEDKSRVLTLIENVGEADDKIGEFRHDLPSKWDDIVKRQDDVRREESERNMRTLETNFQKVAETLPENTVLLREIDSDVPGAEEWNNAIRAARERGMAILKGGNGVTFADSAAVAIKGSDYDRVSKMLLETRKELNEANKRLAEFDKGGPDFKGRKKPEGGEEKLKPADKYRKTMAALQGGGDEGV